LTGHGGGLSLLGRRDPGRDGSLEGMHEAGLPPTRGHCRPGAPCLMGTDGELVRRGIGTTCAEACAIPAELTRLGSHMTRISTTLVCVRSRRAMTASSLPLGWDGVRLHHRERGAQKPGPLAGSPLCPRDARRELDDSFGNFVGSVRSPPCGVPFGVACHLPSSTTPTVSHWRMSFNTRRSLTRRCTSRSSRPWSMVSNEHTP
jgi:hypothetical protein